MGGTQLVLREGGKIQFIPESVEEKTITEECCIYGVKLKDIFILGSMKGRVGYSRGYGDIISHKILRAHTKCFRKFTRLLSHLELYKKYITS